MRVREVEVGGVFGLDKYENVRVSIRVVVEDDAELGEAIDWLAETTEKVADIIRVVRRWKDVESTVSSSIECHRRSAERLRKDAEELREKLREEARQLLRNLNLAILPEDIRKKVEEDPLNIFTCGLATSSCVRLADIDRYLRKAEEEEARARELEEKLGNYREKFFEMKRLAKRGRIDEAWKLAQEIWRFYEEECKATW